MILELKEPMELLDKIKSTLLSIIMEDWNEFNLFIYKSLFIIVLLDVEKLDETFNSLAFIRPQTFNLQEKSRGELSLLMITLPISL